MCSLILAGNVLMKKSPTVQVRGGSNVCGGQRNKLVSEETFYESIGE